eukprot:TRINITY_DN1724_c0_g1_i3.p1 TRINITY_DN1724_c0_g1~~TRINITY_DN1724_c0_g1_i3.p1  ORF type:complete len:191 (+),score=45.59 TRINITY_DN1724_c0_g1_i3:53-574(+)
MMHKAIIMQAVKSVVQEVIERYQDTWEEVDKDMVYKEIVNVLRRLGGGVEVKMYEPVASMQHMCCEIDKFLVVQIGQDDVLTGDNTLVVDLHFKARFSLIRASEKYAKFYGSLKPSFVGSLRSLHTDIHLLCQNMAASFKSSKMEYPPWRTELVYRNSYDFRNTSKVQAVCCC